MGLEVFCFVMLLAARGIGPEGTGHNPQVTVLAFWENSLEGLEKNDAPFYSPGTMKLPSIALVSFSFPSMALPLVLKLNHPS